MKTEKGKVKKQPPAEMPTSLFLQKNMVAPGEKAVVYSIENELAAAGKNRGLALYLSLGLFALLLLAGTFGITAYIDRSNKSIAIDISDFEDINMQELLHSLRNAGRMMAEMKENMEALKGQIDSEMQKIRVSAKADLDRLKKDHSLTQSRREAMMKKILEDRDRRMASVNSEYESRLREKEQSIQAVKSQMSGYQEQIQRTMDNYAKNLEKKMMEYRSDARATRAGAEMMVRQMEENHALKRLEEKREYEKKLAGMTTKAALTEQALKEATGKASDIEQMLSHYRRALMHYAFTRGEQGHVLSVRRDGGLLVVLNPLVEVEKPVRGMVLNSSGAVIASIEITPGEGAARARVLKKLSGSAISPFDLIVVSKE